MFFFIFEIHKYLNILTMVSTELGLLNKQKNLTKQSENENDSKV